MRFAFAPLLLVACTGRLEPPPVPAPVVAPPLVDAGPGFQPVIGIERVFPASVDTAARFGSCIYASPIAFGDSVLVAGDDRVDAYDAGGVLVWSTTLPAPEGERALVVGTPVLVDELLIVAYHTTAAINGNRGVGDARIRHLVVALLPSTGALDPRFPTLELVGSYAANGGSVDFRADHALGRAALVHVDDHVIVTYGNARDIQPWHGYAFSISLSAWRTQGPGAAIRAFFVTTPEPDCGPEGVSGSRDRRCGGGLWAPSGPLVVGNELILATGNGQLDLDRSDYANTLMRVGPELDFVDGCDPASCADFNADAPSLSCVESCENLFIPRMPEGERFADLVAQERCQGMGMFECWAVLDYVGGSTPTVVTTPSGEDALLYPTKDGAVYLVDLEHLGRMHQRLQLVDVCGTFDEPCQLDWAGMIVTQPLVVGEMAIVPTVLPHFDQPGGVVGLRVVDGPRVEVAWRFPAEGSSAARERFRRHPSRASAGEIDGTSIAWLVEASRSAERGRLLALNTEDGSAVFDVPMLGLGYRFVAPLVVGDRVYAPSCESNTSGDAWLEGFRLIR